MHRKGKQSICCCRLTRHLFKSFCLWYVCIPDTLPVDRWPISLPALLCFCCCMYVNVAEGHQNVSIHCSYYHYHYRTCSRGVCSIIMCAVLFSVSTKLEKNGRNLLVPCSSRLSSGLHWFCEALGDAAMTQELCVWCRPPDTKQILCLRVSVRRLVQPSRRRSRWISRREVMADELLNALTFLWWVLQPSCRLHTSPRSATCWSPTFPSLCTLTDLCFCCCYLFCMCAGLCWRCKPQTSLLSPASQQRPTQPSLQSPESRYSSRVRAMPNHFVCVCACCFHIIVYFL